MKSSQNAAEANGAVTVDLLRLAGSHSADTIQYRVRVAASVSEWTNIKELLDDDSLL